MTSCECFAMTEYCDYQICCRLRVRHQVARISDEVEGIASENHEASITERMLLQKIRMTSGVADHLQTFPVHDSLFTVHERLRRTRCGKALLFRSHIKKSWRRRLPCLALHFSL